MRSLVANIVSIILQKLGYINFSAKVVDKQPLQKDIPSNTIMVVGGKDWAKWVHLKCPCGCGDVLTLSLMKSYNPNWKIKIDKLNRVTLSPSIWKKDGCRSHFFIEKGKLIWSYGNSDL